MKDYLKLIVLLLAFLPATRSQAQLPTANFTATPVTGCNPLVVQFTSTSTGNPTSYSWNFGNGASSSVLPNPSVTYTAPGTYTVSLTVSNANGSNTKTVNGFITVLPPPNVVFTASPTSGCPPLTVTFTNTSTSTVPGPLSYQWVFGDGTPIINSQNPVHTYTGSQLYPVVLQVIDGQSCTQSATQYINVFPKPVINFTANNIQCGAPAVVNFTSSITGTPPYNYQWTFGDGGLSGQANPSHTYASPGQFTVRLIVTDANGCKDTLTRVNYVQIGSLQPDFSGNGCMGSVTHFTNLTPFADSVFWNFGDGGTDTTHDPDHQFNTPGPFQVKLIVYFGNCKDSITKTISPYPKPVAAFTFNPQQPCPPPATIQFVNQSSGATSYTWLFGDGGTSSAANPTHTYNSDSIYFPRLVVTNSFGCSDTSAQDTLQAFPLHLWLDSFNKRLCLGDTVFPVGVPYTYLFNNQPWRYPYPTFTWLWDFGDGGVSNVQYPAHLYTARGQYTVRLTITTSNGCTITDSTYVLVGVRPNAGFYHYPDSVCTNDSVFLINTSTGAQWCDWHIGNSVVQSGGTVSIAYLPRQAGLDTIFLVAWDYGCPDTFGIAEVFVKPPVSKFRYKIDCSNLTQVRFYDTLSTNPTSHVWLFGDGTTSTATNPIHTFPALGIYSVSLATYNSYYGCRDTLTDTVYLVNPALTVSAPDTAICEGDSLVFTPTYGNYGISNFTWSYDNFVPFYPTPTPPPYTNHSSGPWGYRFNKKGLYRVNVVAGDINGCLDTAYQNIIVAKPAAGFFASPKVACTPANISFTDTSSNVPGAYSVIREWTFGNGSDTVLTATTNRIYPLRGLYNVRLIVTDNIGCKDTLEKKNYIDVRQPTAAFTVNDSNACIGQLLVFNNNSTGTGNKYFWSFGDGATDTAKIPFHRYGQIGAYTVKLIVTDNNGCKDSLVKTSYIQLSKPSASFTVSDSLAICPPLSLIAINTSVSSVSYAWAMGNGSTSSLQNPTASYLSPGIYSIRLIAYNIEGCPDTAYGQVRVLGYSGALSYAPLNGCAPLLVKFKSQLYNIPSIIWDFSDGVTQPANGIDSTTHIYNTPGAYVPKLILSDNTGCQNSSQGNDTIKVDGVYAGFVTTPACVRTPVSFTDTSFSFFTPLTGRRWNINNGQAISTSQTVTTVFPSAGVFPVTIVATNAQGCSDSITKNISIYGLPLISAGSDTSICQGDWAQLSASGGQSYVWTPPTGLSCDSCPNPKAAPTAAAVYIVTGTDANGCVNKDTVTVKLQTVTTSVVGNGGEICQDSVLQLMASGAQRYEWTPSESLNNSRIPNPLASPAVTTLYTVIAWEGSCQPDTHTVKVVVYPTPTVNAGPDVTIVAGSSTLLNATGTNIENYLWSPSASLSCDRCGSPEASPRVTTQYKVIVTSEYGCRASDTVLVTVRCDQSQVFIPNTFSPNGDGQNDVFYPRGTGLKSIRLISIYNRWGEKVFERSQVALNDAAQGWDGTYKGAVLSPDVYVYILEGYCEDGAVLKWKGDITLIR